MRSAFASPTRQVIAALGAAALSAAQACAVAERPIIDPLSDSIGCHVGDTRVTDVMTAEKWAPVSAGKWQFSRTEAILAEAGSARPGPRRPFEYAILSAGPVFGSVHIDSAVRIDTPVETRDRDVIILLGYQSDTEFYYVHLSTDNTIYPHNGIFVVNNADRRRIDDQWDEHSSKGAAPAITDGEWHRLQVVRCVDSGKIAVYIDESSTPLMTATDVTFRSGRMGFGSFDNTGRLRDLAVTGTSTESTGRAGG